MSHYWECCTCHCSRCICWRPPRPRPPPPRRVCWRCCMVYCICGMSTHSIVWLLSWPLTMIIWHGRPVISWRIPELIQVRQSCQWQIRSATPSPSPASPISIKYPRLFECNDFAGCFVKYLTQQIPLCHFSLLIFLKGQLWAKTICVSAPSKYPSSHDWGRSLGHISKPRCSYGEPCRTI